MKYIIISIPSNLNGNWEGNHNTIKENINKEEVDAFFIEDQRLYDEARANSFSSYDCNKYISMTMEEYDEAMDNAYSRN